MQFKQNDANNIDIAFFATDSPDGGPLAWNDIALGGSTFGNTSGTVSCYYRIPATDQVRLAGTLSPGVTIAGTTYDYFLVGVQEGGTTTGKARLRVATTPQSCIAPVAPAFTIDGDVVSGQFLVYP